MDIVLHLIITAELFLILDQPQATSSFPKGQAMGKKDLNKCKSKLAGWCH